MRLPPVSAAPYQRIHFGCYVESALITEDNDAAARIVREQIDAIKFNTRALEDIIEALFSARARRDLADWRVDYLTRRFRQGLMNRSLEATRTEPYTLILPDGVEFYTEAPIHEQVQRYTLLRERVLTHLPEADPLRAPFVADLDRFLIQWSAAQAALDEARRNRIHAAQKLETSERAFDKVITDVWADQVKAEDKKSAERFFPKPARKAKKGPSSPEPGPPDA